MKHNSVGRTHMMCTDRLRIKRRTSRDTAVVHTHMSFETLLHAAEEQTVEQPSWTGMMNCCPDQPTASKHPGRGIRRWLRRAAPVQMRSQGEPFAAEPFICCAHKQTSSAGLVFCFARSVHTVCLRVVAGEAVSLTSGHVLGRRVLSLRVLGREGIAVESAARSCIKGGGLATTNRDFSSMAVSDGRRSEVVGDALSLFGGAQRAIDTTLVSALVVPDGVFFFWRTVA